MSNQSGIMRNEQGSFHSRLPRVTGALEGMTAVITGGGSGLGAAISLALARARAKVFVLGRASAALAAVVQKAEGYDTTAAFYQVDLSDAAALDTLVARLLHDLDRVDILVQNAAFYSSGEVQKASSEDLDRHYSVNLRAPFVLTKGLLPLLKVCRGQVVFINSSAGVTASADASQYSAT